MNCCGGKTIWQIVGVPLKHNTTEKTTTKKVNVSVNTYFF